MEKRCKQILSKNSFGAAWGNKGARLDSRSWSGMTRDKDKTPLIPFIEGGDGLKGGVFVVFDIGTYWYVFVVFSPPFPLLPSPYSLFPTVN
jgi:hypothetical protein